MRISFSILLLTTVIGLAVGGEARGQELPLKVALPPPAPGPCESDDLLAALEAAPSAADRERADALLADASEAAILGDDSRALELLREAAGLDPTHSGIAYRLGRLLESTGEDEGAVREFCRYLLLDPEGADVADVETRIDRLAVPEEDEIPGIARAAFQQGIGAFQERRFEDAVLHFSRALVELPRWADAHYNRGLAQIGEGRMGAGVADLERYLELADEAPDRTRVESRIEALTPQTRSYSAGTALISGLVFPGMGHFYSGRPGTGFLVLVGAGAGVAAGVLRTEVEIDCLVRPDNGECPPGQISERTETRPLLVPGLAVAGAITVLGAIHAYRGVDQDEARIGVTSDGAARVGLWGAASGGWRATLELGPSGSMARSGFTTGLRVHF